MNEKKVNGKLIVLGVAIIVAAVILIILIGGTPENEYLKEVFTSEAKILETSVDEDAYYIRLSLLNQSVGLGEEQSWFEVSKEFYQKCSVDKVVGVLVGNFDVYKEKSFGIGDNPGQKFVKSVYGIVDVYESLEALNTKYPHKTFSADAKLMQRNVDGNYFVLSYDNREMAVQVEDATFNKYKENDMVACNFDGIGDFVKIVDVKE